MGIEEWLRRAVADVLQRILGAFVLIDRDALKLDVMNGHVTLHGLALRTEAFEVRAQGVMRCPWWSVSCE